MEFYPLGVAPDHSGIVVYETGYLARNDWWNFPNVLSPFWRLYYNFKRGHRVIFPSREYELTPEHMMLIPDQQFFHCQGETPVSNLWIAFNVARRLDARQAVPIRLRPRTIELSLIRQLVRLFSDKKSADSRTRIFHHSLALLHVVLNRPEIQWSEQASPEGIQRSVRRVETAFGTPLTVPELARIAGLSLRGYTSAFKRCHGVSPARYLTQVRVREAAHLLANTDETIESITAKTGFPNRDYFSRVFKRVTGEPPAHFRRVHTGRGETK